MNSFCKWILATAVGTTVGLAAGAPAHANPSFTLGNNPQPDEENILLGSGATGSLVTGMTNTGHLVVNFSSTTDTLTEPNSGQARVEASDGAVNNLTIAVPGGYYTDLIMNPKVGNVTHPASVTVVADDGTFVFNYPSGGLSNGNNFLTIIAASGEKILSTTINSPLGFDDLRQPRISGAALYTTPKTPVTPEPCTLALLGLGALPLAARLRRRQA
jgi:hypothetical protein